MLPLILQVRQLMLREIKYNSHMLEVVIGRAEFKYVPFFPKAHTPVRCAASWEFSVGIQSSGVRFIIPGLPCPLKKIEI